MSKTLTEIFEEFNALEFQPKPKGYYVYLLYETEGVLPFYVGKGKTSRAWQHLRPRVYFNSWLPVHQKIRELISKGLYPKVIIHVENLIESTALELEIELIKKFGRRSINTGCLLNLTEGGDGGATYGYTGRKHTKETKIKISSATAGNQNSLGHRHSVTTKLKMSGSSKRKRRISCSFNGTLIRMYDSIVDIEKDGFCRKSIHHSLTGMRKNAYGFQWKYED